MPDSASRRAAGTELPEYALILRALAATRRELLPECWNKGALAVDVDGRETEPEASETVAWCVQGVLVRHLLEGTPSTVRTATQLLHKTAKQLSQGRHDTLFAFNDAPTTTFADIDRLLAAAIAAVEAPISVAQQREPIRRVGSPRTPGNAAAQNWQGSWRKDCGAQPEPAK